MTGLAQLDNSILQSLYSLRGSGSIRVFSVVTELGSFPFVVSAMLALALYFLYRGRRGYVLGVLLAVAGGFGVGTIINTLVARPRPPAPFPAVVEDGFSFPSRHALAAAALYGFVILVVHRLAPQYRTLVSVILALVILTIGFSRLYLGVHYVSDVAAGYIIGGCFAYFGAWVAKRYT